MLTWVGQSKTTEEEHVPSPQHRVTAASNHMIHTGTGRGQREGSEK